ncbi:hypoxia-inducible factor 1-alpha isoform X2 [Folsomia candida]|uniref:hypoxia-inducible factor 1-alpha isoform X2 n=1 Tax=Folsomia candida TaxID=158441 RepID=UPI0016054824|nr:hypoxia-inducible factor 1-alpha isoform X2 [Folsomia candida]
MCVSLKNAEKRRERSKVAARCRRGKECEIFNDLSASLPIFEASKATLDKGMTLDKASVMRLTLCNLRLKKIMKAVANGSGFWNGHPVKKDQIKLPSFFNSDFESQMNQAMGGFILVFGLDGDVIYASEGITTQLGISQHEIMGQSIFEFSHQYDHNDIRSMLKVGEVAEASSGGGGKRSALFRMKCTVSSRGRNAHLRSANYKVVNCIGRMMEGVGAAGEEEEEENNSNNNQWFISICEPLLHPSDVDIPLNKQTFLSKHTPDMKFDYVDDAVAELLGYTPEEMIGRSLFEFNHAGDGEGIGKAFKSLYDKDQNQTDRYRFLTKGGGWIWIITQATVISGQNGSNKGPNSVVCIHFITSGREEEDQVLSEVQIGDAVTTTTALADPKQRTVADRKLKINNIKIQIEPPMSPVEEENNFIADLLVGPLLNQATCSTSKIFTPKTKDMDTGFLMHVDDTLIASKEEPDDLTHLAPIAGDECVPLDVPLLEDLLASLDADDMSYSFLDDDTEVQKFDIVALPPKVKVTPPPKPPVVLNLDGIMLSGQRDPVLFSTATPDLSESPSPPTEQLDCGDYFRGSVSPLPPDLALAVPMVAIQAEMITREKPVAHFEQRIPIQPPKKIQQVVKQEKVVPEATWNLVEQIPNKVQRLDGGDDQPAKVYILVPVQQTRRGSFTTTTAAAPTTANTTMGTASISSPGSESSDNSGRFDLVDLVRAQQFQLQQQALINKELLASMDNMSRVQKHGRKRNFVGSLLGQNPLSMHELTQTLLDQEYEQQTINRNQMIQLTRQDCEVNAPLSRNADLLQGPDLLKALEIGTIADVV